MRRRDRERLVRNYFNWSAGQWTPRGCVLGLVFVALVGGIAVLLAHDPAWRSLNHEPPSIASAPALPIASSKPPVKAGIKPAR